MIGYWIYSYIELDGRWGRGVLWKERLMLFLYNSSYFVLCLMSASLLDMVESFEYLSPTRVRELPNLPKVEVCSLNPVGCRELVRS